MSCQYCEHLEDNDKLAVWPDAFVEIRHGCLVFESTKWASVKCFPIRHCPKCGAEIDTYRWDR